MRGLGIFLIVMSVGSFKAAAQESAAPTSQRVLVKQLTKEQKSKIKEGLTRSAREAATEAKNAGLMFIRRHQQQLAAENEEIRMRIAELKQLEAKLSPERKRIGEIQREAGELVVRYRTAGTKDREEIDKRAAALVEELNRIRPSSPASKSENQR